MRGFGGLDGVRLALGLVVERGEDGFAFFGAEALVDGGAAGGDEEEDGPEGDVEVGEEVGDGVELVAVVFGDGGVDLDGQSDLAGVADDLEGLRERAADAAEVVVGFGVGAVEGDGQAV